jgi:mercuric ion transport protein
VNVKHTLLAGALAAIGASACCVGPLVLLSLGIGGAWISTLTRLEPLRPLFVVLALALLALAWRRLYRAPACVPGQACANPKVARRQKTVFWLIAPLLLGLMASPWIVPHVV